MATAPALSTPACRFILIVVSLYITHFLQNVKTIAVAVATA